MTGEESEAGQGELLVHKREWSGPSQRVELIKGRIHWK